MVFVNSAIIIIQKSQYNNKAIKFENVNKILLKITLPLLGILFNYTFYKIL